MSEKIPGLVVTCRGSWMLGTVCGTCERCSEEKQRLLAEGWVEFPGEPWRLVRADSVPSWRTPPPESGPDQPAPQKRPPLGLRPRHVVEELRCEEILGAMARCVEAEKDVPWEWAGELIELIDRVELVRVEGTAKKQGVG